MKLEIGSLDRLRKNLDRLRKKRRQVEKEDGVELWITELEYDEPAHLAWFEELDMDESEV